MNQVSDNIELQGYDAFAVSLGDKMRGERATMGKTLSDIENELKLREEILLGIENCDLSAFPSPSFVAGYVRSYAGHLGLDPKECFDQFCLESGFVGLQSQIDTGKVAKSRKPVKPTNNLDDAILNPRVRTAPMKLGIFSQFSVSGIASLGVVCALIAGLSWGGLTVLKEVQRVQFSPVNDTPNVEPHVAALNQDEVSEDVTEAPSPQELALLKDRRLEELYRPAELSVPRLTPRDGAISTIDPDSFGVFVTTMTEAEIEIVEPVLQPQVTEVGPPSVDVVALNPAWVRVFQENGDILFEKILDSGQRYRVPAEAADVLMRAGNSGSVYLMVGDEMFGPVGTGTGVARKVDLNPVAIAETYTTIETKFDQPLKDPINQSVTAEASQ